MLKITSYELLLEMTKIFQRAVKRVQKSHKENGLPNVYSKNGEIVWELPDGSYVKENPFGEAKDK
ncbi:MAG: hypothetical protein Q7J16_13070 [Candidatus Cloacimonadales bacterium]|nr:hypothetical protein [Candidatus Cloacimonadales bacterium]